MADQQPVERLRRMPEFLGQTGQAQAPRPAAEPGVGRAAEPGVDLMAKIRDMAHDIETLGVLCSQSGAADARDCQAQANELVASARRFLATFLARKKRELAELERLSGQVGGGP